MEILTPTTEEKENGGIVRAVLLDLSSVIENAPYLLEASSGSAIPASLGQSQSSSHTGCQSSHGYKARSGNLSKLEDFSREEGPTTPYYPLSKTRRLCDIEGTNIGDGFEFQQRYGMFSR